MIVKSIMCYHELVKNSLTLFSFLFLVFLFYIFTRHIISLNKYYYIFYNIIIIFFFLYTI